VRLLVGILGNRIDAATVMAAPPLLYNYEPSSQGEQFVPEGAYDPEFLKNLETAGMTVRQKTATQVNTLKGTVVVGLIDPESGTRRSVETPGVFGFTAAY
jgi:hypothetical protein